MITNTCTIFLTSFELYSQNPNNKKDISERSRLYENFQEYIAAHDRAHGVKKWVKPVERGNPSLNLALRFTWRIRWLSRLRWLAYSNEAPRASSRRNALRRRANGEEKEDSLKGDVKPLNGRQSPQRLSAVSLPVMFAVY